jgi:hypothetical protein
VVKEHTGDVPITKRDIQTAFRRQLAVFPSIPCLSVEFQEQVRCDSPLRLSNCLRERSQLKLLFSRTASDRGADIAGMARPDRLLVKTSFIEGVLRVSNRHQIVYSFQFSLQSNAPLCGESRWIYV